MATPASGLLAASVQPQIELLLPMTACDRTVFLLRTAANIEHALMVQYLYAAYSLSESEDHLVSDRQRMIRDIAKQEMAHIVCVQNLLRSSEIS
jgi:hypothetical protein